jgi:uncharacterized membrane protein YciS (DUF1049 family)
MEWLKEHWFRLGILLAWLIIAGSVCYYFVIYIPNKNEQESSDKSAQASVQADSLQECLDTAQDNARKVYFNYCITSGEYSNPQDCPYQLPIGGTMLTAYEADRDACFKQYPQN